MSNTMLGPVGQGDVTEVGRGPAVLLVHGTAPGTTADGNFAKLIPSLTEHCALAPDLIGFGASPKPLDVDYGPALWAQQGWEVLDTRGIDRVVVVGNSMGARVALSMAAQQPDRVRGLVLLSTRMTHTNSPAQALLRDYVPSLAGMEQLVRECFVTDPRLVTPELVRRRYEDSARPGAHEAMQHVFAGLASAGSAPDPAELAAITAPTLLLHGRQDRIVPYTDGARLAELLPQADLHVLARTGHWLQVERATTVNLLIDDFLRRCPA